MPEMADVEVLKRRCNEELKDQTITGVKILNPALVKGAPGLEQKLTGRGILSAERYGKYLFIKLSPQDYLILHFGLTGRLVFEKDKNKRISSEAMLIISTDSFQLIYEGGKIFGMAGWCEAPKNFIAEKKLGPDAGEVSEETFVDIVRSSKGAIKPVLLDQQKIAGVGNVYADEILLQAGVHPQVPVKGLTVARIKKIFEEIHRIHDSAVRVNAVRTEMPAWALMKTRKVSTLCPKCAGGLRNTLVNSRETIYCPSCQHL